VPAVAVNPLASSQIPDSERSSARLPAGARRGLRPIAALAVLLMLSSAAGPVRAEAGQPAGADRARALFQEGVAAAADGRFDEAARAFGESDALHGAPTTRYNLAAALFELGRYPEAYDALAGLSWPAGTASEIRNRADGLLKRLEPRVTHLRVQLAGESAGVVVLVDGTPLDPGELGKPRTLPPGDHALEVTRDRVAIAARPLALAARASTAVELVVLPAPAAATAVPAAEPAPLSSEPAPRVWRSWELWTAIGAALVVGGVAGWAITAATHDDTHAAPAESAARFAW
jgi:tetratricopeptide (TPR) repeat protein